MKNLGGRPPYRWSDEQVSELLRLWNQGFAVVKIAAHLKISNSTVSKKLAEMGLTRAPLVGGRPAGTAASDSSWDEKLFEPWAERKARLERERANGKAV